MLIIAKTDVCFMGLCFVVLFGERWGSGNVLLTTEGKNILVPLPLEVMNIQGFGSAF